MDGKDIPLRVAAYCDAVMPRIEVSIFGMNDRALYLHQNISTKMGDVTVGTNVSGPESFRVGSSRIGLAEGESRNRKKSNQVFINLIPVVQSYLVLHANRPLSALQTPCNKQY